MASSALHYNGTALYIDVSETAFNRIENQYFARKADIFGGSPSPDPSKDELISVISGPLW
jgi:hypothetical protein